MCSLKEPLHQQRHCHMLQNPVNIINPHTHCLRFKGLIGLFLDILRMLKSNHWIWVRGGQVYDHCPLQSTCWISSILISHVHAVFTSRSVADLASLGQTCFLELARGFTYTVHVNPPRDGGPRAIPEVLKGPPMSFLHLVLTHLLLKLKRG